MGCGREDDVLCSGCRSRLAPPPTTTIRDVGRVDALFAYEDVGAAVVQALKFRNARCVIASIADDLAALVTSRVAASSLTGLAAVTWLPTSPARRRSRGFDQAELLARCVARRFDVPAVAVLRRRPGAPQTGLSWEERAENVQFSLRRRALDLGGGLAVFDDVCTTGATVRSAWAALGEPTEEDVAWFSLARTP